MSTMSRGVRTCTCASHSYHVDLPPSSNPEPTASTHKYNRPTPLNLCPSSALPLLLRRYNLKLLRDLILLLAPHRPLLRNLAPTARTRASTLTNTRKIHRGPGLGHDPFLRKFPSADEFLGEATALERLGGAVDGLGDDLELCGQLREGFDEVIGFGGRC